MNPKVPPKPKAPKQTRKPGVEVGDAVYFKLGDQHTHGKVVCHGEHGCHIDHEGGRSRVYWNDVLGHKARSATSARVVDKGDDGFLMEDDKGRRRFVAGELPEPEREDTPDDHRAMIQHIHRNTPMTKSIALPGERLLFFKAHVKAYTTKKGTYVAEHDDKRASAKPKQPAAPRPPAAGKAPEVGHHVKFEAGDHKGEGHVTAVGKDGVTVKDSSGREHGIRHEEVKESRKPLFHPDEVAKLPAKKNQPVASKEELYAKSEEALGQLKSWLEPLAKSMGMKTDAKMDDVDWGGEGHYCFIAPLKGEKRATEKVEADYGGDWSQLRDVVRCSLAVDTIDQLHDVLGKLKENGLKLAMQPKDRFAKPTPVGYRDLLMNIGLPNGTIGEMQLHVKGMLEAKEQGHKPYEVMRSLFAEHGEESDLASWPEEHQKDFLQAVDDSKKIYGEAWDKLTKGKSETTAEDSPKTQQNDADRDAPVLNKSMSEHIMKLPVLLFRKVV